jgi:hypothetical protein
MLGPGLAALAVSLTPCARFVEICHQLFSGSPHPFVSLTAGLMVHITDFFDRLPWGGYHLSLRLLCHI